MTFSFRRSRVQQKLAGQPGVRAVRRPITPGSADEFDLYYVRSGRESAHPLVIIPGGPGVASIQLYKGLRRRVAALDVDVIMIEHRGVGMSRQDDDGADLPPEALTIDQVVDDVAAVLDDAGAEQAIVYGTSYGTYLASGVGVRHPSRVRAMVLDSPLLSRDDIDAVRDAIRGLLLHGNDPATADLAPKVRQLVDDGVLNSSTSQVAATVYGIGGAPLLERQLNLLLRGRTLLWAGLRLVERLTFRKVPYHNETDLVGQIGFRELNYAGVPDGLPLDPSEAMLGLTADAPEFEGEPYDLIASMPTFAWPTVVISGGRDLTTPPAVADQIAGLIPDAVLVRLPTAGHSALDTRERAALAVIEAVWHGESKGLPARATELDELPENRSMWLAATAINAAAAVEGRLPSVLPGVGHGSSAQTTTS